MNIRADDVRHMSRALELAQNGLLTTTPNPRVGCLIVKNGQVVGEGWHVRAGEPHAEVHALLAAGTLARDATAYVTLEPCNHFGRTPPCTEALIAAGVRRVVVAMSDPNPLVAGQGITRLTEAGITTELGLMGKEAEELNLGFVSRMRRQRPWIRIKTAASLDGKTALSNGRSQWITGPLAREDGHLWRARSCAVLTGAGTILNDDPQLNVRGTASSRQPHRVVLDTHLRTPPTARILKSDGGSTYLLHGQNDLSGTRRTALENVGACLVALPCDAAGHLDLAAVMHWLNSRSYNEVHVEAGAILNGALFAAGWVDELIYYLAPCLLGHTARSLFELPELTSLEQASRLHLLNTQQLGPDLRLQFRPT